MTAFEMDSLMTDFGIRWEECSQLWTGDKLEACQQLTSRNPTLSDYDRQLRRYKSDWSRRVSLMEHRATISCVVYVT